MQNLLTQALGTGQRCQPAGGPAPSPEQHLCQLSLARLCCHVQRRLVQRLQLPPATAGKAVRGSSRSSDFQPRKHQDNCELLTQRQRDEPERQSGAVLYAFMHCAHLVQLPDA